jgi:hypothetical protein
VTGVVPLLAWTMVWAVSTPSLMMKASLSVPPVAVRWATVFPAKV